MVIVVNALVMALFALIIFLLYSLFKKEKEMERLSERGIHVTQEQWKMLNEAMDKVIEQQKEIERLTALVEPENKNKEE